MNSRRRPPRRTPLDGEVVVDEFGLVRLQLHGVPHHRVEVRKVVVHVDALVAVAAQSAAGHLRTLRGDYVMIITLHHIQIT